MGKIIPISIKGYKNEDKDFNAFIKNADLSTSYNFMIDPGNNILKKAGFSVRGLPGLLAKYDIRGEG